MEKCPRCEKYMVAFDSYRRVKRCHNDACSAHVHEDGSYSFLRGASNNKAQRIRKFPDGTEKITREIDLL